MITIAKTSQDTILDPARNVIRRVRVEWYADKNHGPYIDYFTLEDFDGGKARAELEAKARQIAALVGPSQ